MTNLMIDSVTPLLTSTRIGKVVGFTPLGQALIDFDGNEGGPVIAQSIVKLSADQHDASVLLMLEEDASLPIIIGLILESGYVEPSQKDDNSPAPAPRVTADGKKMVLEAKREIVLQCGKSSITLKTDGKILVKGTNIVSRATNKNKLKGGSVAIN
ncbi:MAG: hypothetical protein CMJ64_08940 [Planctomycetaceae bacterium]|nr:hypothetical protein [Planctomycetaceae bacterium]